MDLRQSMLKSSQELLPPQQLDSISSHLHLIQQLTNISMFDNMGIPDVYLHEFDIFANTTSKVNLLF